MGRKRTLTDAKREAHQSPVLTVHSPPLIEADPQNGWQLTFWLGEAFDFEIPFREALSTILRILQRSCPVTLDLPPFTPGENFVEGELTCGGRTVKVYYEHSLGYLSLMSQSRDALEDVAVRVLPFVRVE
jgi:hypothetical protein